MSRKGLFSITLIIVMLAGWIPVFELEPQAVRAAGAIQTYLSEDFNSSVQFPTGQSPHYSDWSSAGNGVPDTNHWVTDVSGGTVTVEDYPSMSNRSVKINRTSTSGTTRAESSIDFTSRPLSGTVTVEAAILSSGSMTGTQVAPYITNGAGASIVKIQLNGGNIKANNGGTQQNVQAFSPGTWYSLKIVVYTSSDTYDLYIDGNPLLTGKALTAASGGSVGKVTFKMDTGNNTGTLYYDNLKVYTTTPAAAVTGLAFDQDTYSAYTGDAFPTAVQAVYADNSRQVLATGNVFSSANSNIASIDPATGVVTARNQGTTQISVSNSVYSLPAAATVTVNPLPILTAPTGLSSGAVSGTSVQLNWSAVPNAGKYAIYRAASGSGQFSKIGETAGISYSDNSVTANASYDYAVSSVFTTPGGQTVESANSAILSVTAAGASGFVINDDFDNAAAGVIPDGWTTTVSGAAVLAVADVPSAADKSLSLYVSGKNDAVEANRAFAGMTGKVAVEAKVMTTGTQFSVAPYIYNNKDKAVMKFGLRNGYFVAIGGSQQINTTPFVPNQWYAVKIVVNTNANTYDLWIDGVQQTIDRSDLVTPFDGTTSIARVMFKADNTAASTSYVDNVKVYPLPPAEVTGITFDQPAYALYEHDTVALKVNSVDSDGALHDVTGSSSLSSSDPAVATIGNTGQLTAVGTGTTQLSAVYTVGSRSYEAHVNVTVGSIQVPAAPQDVQVTSQWSTSISLKWTPAANAAKYSVYRANAGDAQYRYVGQSQPGIAAYIDNNVSQGVAYSYNITSLFTTPGGQTIESAPSDPVSAATAAPPVNFPPAAKEMTVRDDFNGDRTGAAPSGWLADTSGGSVSVQEVPFPADKSVMVAKSAAAKSAAASRTFAALSGIVTLEAKVKAQETAGTKYIPYIYDGSGNQIAAIAFKDGNIVYNKNGTLTNAGVAFNADKWYIIRAVIDTKAKKYDLYIDGMKKAGDIGFLTAAADVGKLAFAIESGSTGAIYFDNVKVYSQAAFIGGPPSPVFDVKSFGAAGDGVTKDTAAIQAAIEAAAGTGGSVYLHDGVFLSGMIQLKSNMTLYIDATATLKGSPSAADYPDTNPLTYNTQLGPASNCNKTLIYAEHEENIKIDGGGTIDGNGDSFTAGSEATRPMAVYIVLSSHVTIQNVYIKKSAMWTVVNAETDYVVMRNMYLDVKLSSNRDGLDIVDSKHVLIEDVTVNTGDDAICIKSGKSRGVEDVLVRNSNVTASGTNGLKFGTASYGAFKNVRFEDNMVKGVKYCAMCVESVDGADVSNIVFQRIDVQDSGNPFFVILGKRSDRATKDDKPRTGTMDTVIFRDIIGKNMNAAWGSPITGTNMPDGTKYRLKNIVFDNVNIEYKGGVAAVPASPPEYALGQYPESNMWGDLPAYGYYVRHADGITFANSTSTVSLSDARTATVQEDAFGSAGIALDSSESTLLPGQTKQITVIQRFDNDSTSDVTAASGFTSSNPNAATVDSAGIVKAVGAGSAEITVAYSEYRARLHVTVFWPSNSSHGSASNDSTTGAAPSQSETGAASIAQAENETANAGRPENGGSVIHANATLDPASGAAKAQISSAQLDDALDKAGYDRNGVKAAHIQVPPVEGAQTYEAALPSTYITSGDSTQKIVLETPLATLELPGNMLQLAEAPASSTVAFSVEFVDKSTLGDAALQQKVGDRPILSVRLKIDGEEAHFDNPQSAVAISIPYTPAEQELADIEHIVVWHIDSEGRAEKVSNGKYDPATGLVTFRTSHFSKFAVSFEFVSFEDLDGYGWAKKQIETLASKGIINGTSDRTFAPGQPITRADFLALLVRTLGATADFAGNFDDVSQTDYFYKELGIARKLGISEGIGDNKFNPSASISRQDMMVLCAKALRLAPTAGEPGSVSGLERFTDQAAVASYAAESIASMIRAGLTEGDGSEINPGGATTRAEAAVILYRIFNQTAS
ncbi:S-layer homology domain-containing protein [Paenibacillus thalictri]|nr:S-layer homology domain-containing protein [Paenibacillus thalictri]